MTFTIVRYSESIHPYEPPFAYAVIKLDGADTGMTHIITGSEAELEKLAIGARVEAVFTDDPHWNIMDIKNFKLLSSEGE